MITLGFRAHIRPSLHGIIIRPSVEHTIKWIILGCHHSAPLQSNVVSDTHLFDTLPHHLTLYVSVSTSTVPCRPEVTVRRPVLPLAS